MKISFDGDVVQLSSPIKRLCSRYQYIPIKIQRLKLLREESETDLIVSVPNCVTP